MIIILLFYIYISTKDYAGNGVRETIHTFKTEGLIINKSLEKDQ